MAFAASSALLIAGKSSEIGRSFLGGTKPSRQSLSAVVSPASPNSIAFRVSAPASPSSNSSAAIVDQFRTPFGLPASCPTDPA